LEFSAQTQQVESTMYIHLTVATCLKIISHRVLPNVLLTCIIIWCVCLMVFNATFNNISVIPWRSVLLVVEITGPGENPRPAASH
jgi:hypothetical protein